MHRGLALDLSYIDLLDKHLSDTDLDLLDTDIDSFSVNTFLAPKMSSRRLQAMSSRLLEYIFSVANSCLPRRLEDVLKIS